MLQMDISGEVQPRDAADKQGAVAGARSREAGPPPRKRRVNLLANTLANLWATGRGVSRCGAESHPWGADSAGTAWARPDQARGEKLA